MTLRERLEQIEAGDGNVFAALPALSVVLCGSQGNVEGNSLTAEGREVLVALRGNEEDRAKAAALVPHHAETQAKADALDALEAWLRQSTDRVVQGAAGGAMYATAAGIEIVFLKVPTLQALGAALAARATGEVPQ